jgi:hypothetical protein
VGGIPDLRLLQRRRPRRRLQNAKRVPNFFYIGEFKFGPSNMIFIQNMLGIKSQAF